jgi:hypothetical protein
MKAIIITAVLLVVACTTHAQVKKCTGPDGKVTYSDALCGAGTAKETGVATNYNTVGSAPGSQEQRPIPQKCKFNYYSVGDPKGKELAEDASKECIANIAAKESGGTTSLDAYTLWKDHHQLATSKRNAAKAIHCRTDGNYGMICN